MEARGREMQVARELFSVWDITSWDKAPSIGPAVGFDLPPHHLR